MRSGGARRRRTPLVSLRKRIVGYQKSACGPVFEREPVSICLFFFSSRRRHTRFDCDWSSDVCSSDLCSAASEIIAVVTEDLETFRALKAPVQRVCAVAVPVPYSPPLEQAALPDQARIDRKSVV